MDIFYFVIAFAFAGLIFNCIMFKLKVDSVVRRHNSLMRDISAARFSLERAKETITEQSNTIEHLTKLMPPKQMTNGFEQWADQELTPLCVCGHDKESHMIGVFLVTPSVRCHVVVQPEGPDFFCNCKGYTPRVNNV